MKCGDPPSKLGARDKLWSDDTVAMYEKKNERMDFGDVNIDEITYLFVQDRELFCVVLVVDGAISSYKFKDTLIARYGEPTSCDSETEYYWWDKKVTINYTYYAVEEQSKVQIYSEKLFNRMKALGEQETE